MNYSQAGKVVDGGYNGYGTLINYTALSELLEAQNFKAT